MISKSESARKVIRKAPVAEEVVEETYIEEKIPVEPLKQASLEECIKQRDRSNKMERQKSAAKQRLWEKFEQKFMEEFIQDSEIE